MKNQSNLIGVIVIAVILVLGIIGTVALARNNPVREQGVWSDATDVLSSKAAEGVDRVASSPIINTEQGNMLVFFFCAGGITAGIIIGYTWRRIMKERAT